MVQKITKHLIMLFLLGKIWLYFDLLDRIRHTTQNFTSYERKFTTFKERVMFFLAFIQWLS